MVAATKVTARFENRAVFIRKRVSCGFRYEFVADIMASMKFVSDCHCPKCGSSRINTKRLINFGPRFTVTCTRCQTSFDYVFGKAAGLGNVLVGALISTVAMNLFFSFLFTTESTAIIVANSVFTLICGICGMCFIILGIRILMNKHWHNVLEPDSLTESTSHRHTNKSDTSEQSPARTNP